MYNRKLNESYLSTRVHLIKNLKSKSSMPLLPDPDSLVELKHVHWQCYVRLNAPKTTQPSWNIEFYGYKARENYNEAPMWFSGIQLIPSMTDSSKTDLKKKSSLNQRQKRPQIMLPVAKNKKV